MAWGRETVCLTEAGLVSVAKWRLRGVWLQPATSLGEKWGSIRQGETILAKRQYWHMNERMGTGHEDGEAPTKSECGSETALQKQ